MFKLDNNFLIELGLGALPAEEKNKMLAHIYETLEMRVGMKLAEQMTDAQLDEFEGYINRSDEAGALTWLESNFPNYKQVVADELERLKGEIRQVAPQIVAESMNAANDASVAPGAPQAPQMAPQAQAFQPAPQPQAYAPAPQPTMPAPAADQYAPQPYQPQPLQPYQPAPQAPQPAPTQQPAPAPQYQAPPMPPLPQQPQQPVQPPAPQYPPDQQAA